MPRKPSNDDVIRSEDTPPFGQTEVQRLRTALRAITEIASDALALHPDDGDNADWLKPRNRKR